MWFEALTGFEEDNPDQVRKNISVNGLILKSHINGEQFIVGRLETPSLAELRNRIKNKVTPRGNISVREVVANTQHLHSDKENTNALFQVASQFNLLEMVSPDVTPERGVDGYEYDLTQGPACAISAGAGTIYRNYFAKVNGRTGQSTMNQIDCLSDLGAALGNSDNHLWEMRNGYALASENGLIEITNKLKQASELDRDALRQSLRIGLHWNTEVTISESRHLVSQAFCSALPVAYSDCSPDLWAEFAQLVLEASYEATICAGILNYFETGNNKIYLTLIGGGAFGNDIEWIINAIERALGLYEHINLDVIIVSYHSSNKQVQNLVKLKHIKK